MSGFTAFVQFYCTITDSICIWGYMRICLQWWPTHPCWEKCPAIIIRPHVAKMLWYGQFDRKPLLTFTLNIWEARTEQDRKLTAARTSGKDSTMETAFTFKFGKLLMKIWEKQGANNWKDGCSLLHNVAKAVKSKVFKCMCKRIKYKSIKIVFIYPREDFKALKRFKSVWNKITWNRSTKDWKDIIFNAVYKRWIKKKWYQS